MECSRCGRTYDTVNAAALVSRHEETCFSPQTWERFLEILKPVEAPAPDGISTPCLIPTRSSRAFGWNPYRKGWILLNGEIEDKLVVRHKCDNNPCIEPTHLELGTQGDNIRDAFARGRIQTPGGVWTDERRKSMSEKSKAWWTDERKEHLAQVTRERLAEYNPLVELHKEKDQYGKSVFAKQRGEVFRRPDVRSAARERGRQALSKKFRCVECDYVSNKPNLAKHQKKTSHKGLTDIG